MKMPHPVLNSLALLSLTLLLACAPQTKDTALSTEIQLSQPLKEQGAKPSLGQFNLQKRHGLGGWDGPPTASEQQLFRQIGQTSKADHASFSAPQQRNPH